MATYIATASKVGAIALICRLVALTADPVGISLVLMWMSVAAMKLGNLAALVQRDLKRLLGYSAIAHGGYVLVGLQAGTALRL